MPLPTVPTAASFLLPEAPDGYLQNDILPPTLSNVLTLLSFSGSAGVYANHHFQKRLVRAGESVCVTPDGSGTLFAVQAGVLKTETVDLKPAYPIAFPRAGDLLGVELITGVFSTSISTAITDVSLLVIPKDIVQLMIRECEAFSLGLYKVLGTYLKASRDHLHSSTKLRATARVAEFLITELKHSATKGNERKIAVPMKRGDIASYLGLTLETLCRSMNELEQAGLIVRSYKSIEVRDPEGLQNRIGLMR